MSIRSELETILSTWATTRSPKIKVSFEGVPFTKPTADSFVECYLIPANSVTPTVSAKRIRETGIFQIDIWCQDGKGSAVIDSLAEEIRALYPVIPKTGTVSIEQYPSVSQPFVFNGWRVLSVLVHYRQELSY